MSDILLLMFAYIGYKLLDDRLFTIVNLVDDHYM